MIYTDCNSCGVVHVNFKYLDDLIHSGLKEIVLDSDIIADDNECCNPKTRIKLDVDDLIIDGNGHTVDARENLSNMLLLILNEFHIRNNKQYFYLSSCQY